MHFNQIKETCLYVRDLNKTESFYAEKLGLKVLDKSEGRHIFFRAGSSVLLCFISDATKNENSLPSHFGEGNIHIAFEVPGEKYSEVKKWILSKQISIIHERSWKRDIRSFYFRDPDDNLLEIVPTGMWN